LFWASARTLLEGRNTLPDACSAATAAVSDQFMVEGHDITAGDKVRETAQGLGRAQHDIGSHTGSTVASVFRQ